MPNKQVLSYHNFQRIVRACFMPWRGSRTPDLASLSDVPPQVELQKWRGKAGIPDAREIRYVYAYCIYKHHIHTYHSITKVFWEVVAVQKKSTHLRTKLSVLKRAKMGCLSWIPNAWDIDQWVLPKHINILRCELPELPPSSGQVMTTQNGKSLDICVYKSNVIKLK